MLGAGRGGSVDGKLVKGNFMDKGDSYQKRKNSGRRWNRMMWYRGLGMRNFIRYQGWTIFFKLTFNRVLAQTEFCEDREESLQLASNRRLRGA